MIDKVNNQTMEKPEESTLKQLQAEIVKVGMPQEDADKFTTKAPLIAALNALKAVNLVRRVDTLDPVVSPKEEKKFEEHYRGKAEGMRAVLEAQSKVRIMIPLENKEKVGVIKWEYNSRTKRDEQVYVSGAFHPFTNNGYLYLVPKGVYVSVPEQIAKGIEERFGQMSEISEKLLIDRIDPDTGRPVSAQL